MIGTLVVLLVAATCVRLGVWQLHRLEQRDALNARVRQRMEAPWDTLDRVPTDTAEWGYRRVVLRGHCDAAHPVVLAGRSYRGSPGVHLMCPFLPAGGGPALLFDRGWAPAADAATVDPELLGGAPRTAVRAMLIPLQGGRTVPARREAMDAGLSSDSGALRAAAPARAEVLYRLNRDAAQQLLPYRVAPLYGLLLPVDTPGRARATLPIPPESPDLGRGPHLGYMVQWWSFAVIGLVGWAILAWRQQAIRLVGPGEVER